MIKNFIYVLFISIFLAILSQAPVWAQVKLESLERVTPPNPPGQTPFEGQFLPGDNHELIFMTTYGCHPCQTAKKVIAEVRAKAPANVRVLDIPLINNFVPRHVQAWAIFSLVLKKWGLEEKLLDEIFELTASAEYIDTGGKFPLGDFDEHFFFFLKRPGL
jgi:thiol-disulfide isomerase/thioredoxin